MRTIRNNLLPYLAILCALPLLTLTSCSDAEEHAATDDEQHEEHIELTQDQFTSAKIAVADAGPARVSEVLTLTGSVEPNADTVLHVTPRVSGQVSEVFKHLGEAVEQGDPLCVLDSVDLASAAAVYLRDKAMLAAAEETHEREASLYEGRITSLTSVLDSAITVQQGIYDREKGLQEKQVSTIRPFLEAEKALELAKLDKKKRLTDLTAERDARLLALDVDRRAKRIALAAAANALRSLGIDDKTIETLNDNSPLVSGEYRIGATSGGIVVSRHLSPGEFVEAGGKLFVINDLSTVWFVAAAFESQLQVVRDGQPVTVHLDAFPGVPLPGTASFVDYEVDRTSRSIGVRIALKNEKIDTWPKDYPLRPGMFGRAALETTSRQAKVVLPERAIVHEDDKTYVFVQVEPLAFERRDVRVKRVAGDKVEVLSGLYGGEKVAVEGTFFLKSVERQAELGGGHGH